MDTKNTILSQKDLELLEAIVLKYGKVVTLAQIQAVIGEFGSIGAVRKRVAQMSKAGWLIRLKKGLYLVVTDISSLGFINTPEIVIARSFDANSYISFESALQHYGMFDQLLTRIDSVSIKMTKTYKVLQTAYSFLKIKNELFFGYTEEVVNNQKIFIAEREKAVLDMLYFRSSGYVITLVLEKLKEYKDQFDFNKLKEYSIKYSLSMIRKIGFLLDQIDVDTTDLLILSESNKKSHSKLTKDSHLYNAKWRLYYDSNLT
ncbi:MAG TPA: hypothetical protein VJ201_04335 [Candidatus Babeliales bacterium]|nr:hypothetical protein [Candidatus Babeliales bacterium]